MKKARKLGPARRAGKMDWGERRHPVTSGAARAVNQLNNCGSRLR